MVEADSSSCGGDYGKTEREEREEGRSVPVLFICLVFLYVFCAVYLILPLFRHSPTFIFLSHVLVLEFAKESGGPNLGQQVGESEPFPTDPTRSRTRTCLRERRRKKLGSKKKTGHEVVLRSSIQHGAMRTEDPFETRLLCDPMIPRTFIFFEGEKKTAQSSSVFSSTGRTTQKKESGVAKETKRGVIFPLPLCYSHGLCSLSFLFLPASLGRRRKE